MKEKFSVWFYTARSSAIVLWAFITAVLAWYVHAGLAWLAVGVASYVILICFLRLIAYRKELSKGISARNTRNTRER